MYDQVATYQINTAWFNTYKPQFLTNNFSHSGQKYNVLRLRNSTVFNRNVAKGNICNSIAF